jgi:hypothetical protein
MGAPDGGEAGAVATSGGGAAELSADADTSTAPDGNGLAPLLALLPHLHATSAEATTETAVAFEK